MLATASVFDVLAADDSERHATSRRALALAHTRVENHLGRFLRAAVTMDEFEARLAMVQDELAAYVASASAETGHEHPEHIARALVDHYARERRWQPRVADAQDTTEQNASEEKVTCSQCGGSGETPNGEDCGKCHGSGKVSNFGASVLDKLEAKTADGNTDLDGPEPKMDKRLWTPQSVGQPKFDDKVHPTQHKDITEPIKARNEKELSEIGNIDRVELPTAKGDAGFASGGPGPAPHTDTFGGDGQADPVSSTALSSVHEAMGLSAQDFRMFADAVRTAPEGGSKAELAQHLANYLAHTNPLFDGERFLAAALGTPQTGRDTYRGPGAPPEMAPEQPLADDAPGNLTPPSWAP